MEHHLVGKVTEPFQYGKKKFGGMFKLRLEPVFIQYYEEDNKIRDIVQITKNQEFLNNCGIHGEHHEIGHLNWSGIHCDIS